MANVDFMAEAKAMREELVTRRRDFHRHPELAFEEVRTAGIVAETLTQLGLEVQTGVGKTGVVGLLEGDQDGPTVLVRADMDALPIVEENRTDYVSTAPGKMHACGHDGHTSIALGVARLFTQHKDKIAGRIKFVFQPAEEIVQGAKAMINDGVLQDPRPDVSLGLHLWNTMPLGRLGVADGPIMSGASLLRVVITGKGGHAASPQLGVDPVVCAAQLIMAFQTIISRNADPMQTGVVSITMLKAGDAHNIIPQQVELQGTFRAFTSEIRDLIVRRINEITQGVCAAMGCTGEVDITHGTIPTINNYEVTSRVRDLFGQMIGQENLDLNARTMGSEDMAYFMDQIPGTYFFLGSANSERGLDYGHHHPRFDFDEDALPLGVALLSAAIAEYVIPD